MHRSDSAAGKMQIVTGRESTWNHELASFSFHFFGIEGAKNSTTYNKINCSDLRKLTDKHTMHTTMNAQGRIMHTQPGL